MSEHVIQEGHTSYKCALQLALQEGCCSFVFMCVGLEGPFVQPMYEQAADGK